MRKKLLRLGMVLSTLLCSCLIVSVDASSGWSQAYGGTLSDYACSVIAASDGGYALAGTSGSFGAGSGDFWLVKTDAFGNMQWNKTYGGALFDEACSLIATSDGGYAIAGTTYSFGTGEDDDFLLVKTDSNGVMEWNQTYGGTGFDYCQSLVEASGGGYAIAGGVWSYETANSNLWLVKTDALGKMEWNRTYGGTGTEGAYSLVATSDGGYAIAGTTTTSDVFGDYWYQWVVKTDTFGNMQWNRTYGGGEARSLIATPDGGYALTGSSLLVKTDALGNMQWNKPVAVLFNEEFTSLVATLDGGYALTGGSLLVKTDALGNVQWNKTYVDGSINSLVATSDGGYALAGSTSSFGAGYSDFWLVKTDESGVYPEYSSWLVPALVLTATAFIVINKKRLLRRRS